MATKTRFYVTYAVVLLIGTVILVEIASALVLKNLDQGDNSEQGSRHLYHPYRSHQLNPEYKRDFDSHGLKLHSDDGFRSDKIYEKSKAENTFRIIMLGGSTLYGIGATSPYPAAPSLKNNETVSYYLEQEINKTLNVEGADYNVEIINAAVTAYTTFHHLVYMNEILYEYEPDLLVFLDGHNDFYYHQPYNNWHKYNFGTVKLTEQFNARSGWFASLSSARLLAKYSNFFMIIERYQQRNWSRLAEFSEAPTFTQNNEQFDERFKSVFQNTVMKSYVQLQSLGSLFNYDMQVFLQPQIVFEDDALLSDEDINLKGITLEHDDNTQRSAIRKLLPEIFKEQKIEFHDVATIASSENTQSQLYTDYCHLTPQGANNTAIAMKKAVLDKINILRE